MSDTPETFPVTETPDLIDAGGGIMVEVKEPEPKKAAKKARPPKIKKEKAPKPAKVKAVKTPKEPKTQKAPKDKVEKGHRKVESDLSGGFKVGSTRVRMFKALASVNYPDGLSARDVKKKTGMSENSGHLGVLLVEEVGRGRVRTWTDAMGKDATPTKLYCLTALGHRDFSAKKVDSSTHAGSRIGKVWTKARKTAEKEKAAS